MCFSVAFGYEDHATLVLIREGRPGHKTRQDYATRAFQGPNCASTSRQHPSYAFWLIEAQEIAEREEQCCPVHEGWNNQKTLSGHI